MGYYQGKLYPTFRDSERCTPDYPVLKNYRLPRSGWDAPGVTDKRVFEFVSVFSVWHPSVLRRVVLLRARFPYSECPLPDGRGSDVHLQAGRLRYTVGGTIRVARSGWH